MGVGDDWSYIRTSQLLAQTGHIHYVGWSTPILGWQLYLGAACIKLFGFSFTAARLPTFLIALLTPYLMQRTLVRLGISEDNAVLGTLTFVLSPLFMMLSATMMTDVPGFFSVLACIYACVRALQAIRDRDAILWLCLAIAVNAICGTSRQIAWLGVLVVVPCTLFLMRSRRTVLLCGLLATALGYLFVFATLHWFNIQPYIQLEPVAIAPLRIWALRSLGRWYLKSLLLIGLLLFPLTLPFVAAVRRFSARNLSGLAALAALFALFAYGLGGTAELRSLFYPFTGDWLGMHALFDGIWLMSTPPIVLNFFAVHLLSVVSMVGTLCVGATILVARPIAIQPPPQISLSWPKIAVLFGPLTFIHLLLLSNRGVYMINDRYLFTPIFFAIVCLLLYTQQNLKVRWFSATCVALGAIAFYGILSIHNTFALARARVLLAKEVSDAGIPYSYVDLGWEMNGWYELQLSSYLNDSRIVRPAGAYHPYPQPHWLGCHQSRDAFGFLLHSAPRYGITFDPTLCDGVAPFAPVSYSTWPLRTPTRLYLVNYPPPWPSPLDVAVQPTPSIDK